MPDGVLGDLTAQEAADLIIKGMDGAIGAKTVQAVRDMQRRLGLAVTGHPGLKILTALRGG